MINGRYRSTECWGGNGAGGGGLVKIGGFFGEKRGGGCTNYCSTWRLDSTAPMPRASNSIALTDLRHSVKCSAILLLCSGQKGTMFCFCRLRWVIHLLLGQKKTAMDRSQLMLRHTCFAKRFRLALFPMALFPWLSFVTLSSGNYEIASTVEYTMNIPEETYSPPHRVPAGHRTIPYYNVGHEKGGHPQKLQTAQHGLG